MYIGKRGDRFSPVEGKRLPPSRVLMAEKLEIKRVPTMSAPCSPSEYK